MPQCFTLNSKTLPPKFFGHHFEPRCPVQQCRMARQVWANLSVRDILSLERYLSVASRG